MPKRRGPREEVDEKEKKEMGGKHSDPATCNCQICVQLCQLCQHNVAIRYNKYCKTCQEEVTALTADAGAHGWMDIVEKMHKTPQAWRALLSDFSQQCPCHGPSPKRRKYDCNRAAVLLQKTFLAPQAEVREG